MGVNKMKKLFFLLLLFLPSCAYNSVKITADNNSSVECTSSVERPVDVNTKASIPAGILP